MSQFPAVSPVSNIHPDDTEGVKPPETDTDKDGIPDVHENLFEEWMNWSTTDGRDVIIPGMDKDNASDALVDFDKDGLNATEEYCWPYPANCTEPGFARGLTGMIDEDGDRQYLDPRVSDTDGDGMPDGFEAYMCARIGGFDYSTLRFDCFRFDPLNSSDMTDDPDDDGFDVNKDGVLSISERFTSSEEYRYGAPANYTVELDGLWCSATLPGGSILKSWPYLPSGNNATFQNLLSACTTNATNVVDEDLWLGSDPLLEDSDRYHWDGFSVRRLFPSYGDGMPDGWEAHFGLDPLNRTDALLDPDGDGWDFNRDGVISPDVSRTRTALKIGEQLSNFEEYLIHYDNGNTIAPGLKTVYLGAEDSTLDYYPLSFTAVEDEMSVIHHDIVDLDNNGKQMYVTTKYGITVLDYEEKTSTDQWMPQGVELFDSIILSQDSVAYALAIATSIGVVVAPLQADGGLSELSSWNWAEIGQVNSVEVLNIEGNNKQLLALGDAGAGNVLEIAPEINDCAAAII